jgi:CheY-like chemotaxis protein
VTDLHPVEILLAEDNETDAELAIRALAKSKVANRVVWVKDGEEALDYMFKRGSHAGRKGGDPRLVLLDLKMPKVDGSQVLAELKRDDRTRSIPVVVMTSSKEERDLEETYRKGVNSYVVKPLDFDQFVDVVSKVGLYWAVVNKVLADARLPSRDR